MAEISPALTADEWQEVERGERGPISYHEVVTWDGYEHAIAALALHGQSFGFTREDVAALQRLIDRTDATSCNCRSCQDIRGGVQDGAQRAAHGPLAALRDRIAALLPE